MKITVIHPSRSRYEQAYNTFRNWTAKADNWQNFEYLLSVDLDEGTYYANRFANFMHNLNITANNNKSAIEAINRAAKVATGDLFVVISDDFDCPEHWDTLLLEALKDKEDFLVKTQDGLQPTLITLPIMDRKYFERFGYVYFPGYKHLFSDQEMTAVGHLLGRVITLDLQFEHLHYTTGKSPKDAINTRNDATWAQGERLFNERLKTNFGIENPVMKYEDIVWK